MRMRIDEIARVAYAANRAYVFAQINMGALPVDWDFLPGKEQVSYIEGIRHLLEHPRSQPAEQHDAWMRYKTEQGWSVGPVKDDVAKTHPCMVPYNQLPMEQQIKDHLFQAVVRSLLPLYYPEGQ